MTARIAALALCAMLGGCSVSTGDGNDANGGAPAAGWSGGPAGAASHASASAAPPAGPAAGSPAGDDLIRQAKAFLARPENDRDMQTALRARAATHPFLCPAVSFVPEQLVVGTNPPPIFDANGTMVKGSLRQRFRAIGCTAKPLLSVFVITAPGMPTRTVAGLMGATIADPQLQNDAIPQAITAARGLIPRCERLLPIDTRFTGVDPVTTGAPPTPWTEYWLVAGCGRYVQTALHFTPDPANARMGIVANSSESKLIALPGI
jgi:hypothetical protein